MAEWLAALSARGPGRMREACAAVAGAPEDERAFLEAEFVRLGAGGDGRVGAAAREALGLLDGSR